LAIRKVLEEKDPGNTEWQRDLALSQNGVGDVLRAQGDFAAALAMYRDALAIAKALAVKDPANTIWQRDLAFTQERIAKALMSIGAGGGAIPPLRDSLAIARALVLRDPSNVLWQTDLVAALVELAGAGDEPAANLTKALTILRRLDTSGNLPADKRAWPAAVEAALAKAGN
jgi:tetratricopeptide (TPR) repeat protein